MLFHSGGVIESWAILNIDPRDWAKISHGKPIVTWDEDVRLVYGSVREVGSGTGEGRVPVGDRTPLRSSRWMIVGGPFAGA